MNLKQITKESKFLSLILRHRPESIGIELDANGWVDVQELLEQMNAHGHPMNREILSEVVQNNNKKRFAFNDDQTKIRANQGHSVHIDLNYQAKRPDGILYHGTGEKYVAAILQSGIQKMKRHHVHLSKDLETAKAVGQRHGKAVVFIIDTEKMLEDAYEFFESENGVWLTDEIPVKYISLNHS